MCSPYEKTMRDECMRFGMAVGEGEAGNAWSLDIMSPCDCGGQ
jgi:hypothetical protein